MFPNVNGFHWTPVHVIFLSIFLGVALAIAISLVLAAWRARRDLAAGRADAIRWHEEFEDLPARDRACRHELTGEFRDRKCDRAFDCRECKPHAQLTALSDDLPPSDQEVAGLRYPGDRLYHRGHTWVKPLEDGTVLIGLDDLARRMFGRVDRMELPAEGTRLVLNSPAWFIRHRGDEVRVLSPVDGTVIECGGPDQEYFLRVRPNADPHRFKHPLKGGEVHAWVVRELERLQLLISADSAAPTLADGGVLVDDVPAMLPKANWPAVWGEMLLEP